MADNYINIRIATIGGEKVEQDFKRIGASGERAFHRINRAEKPVSKGLLALNAGVKDLQGGMHAGAARLGVFGSSLSAIGPSGLAAAAGLAAVVFGAVGLARAAGNAAEALSAIKAEAQTAGTAVETFQALQYAADQYSVSQGALTDGLKELNLRANEFVREGAGPGAKAFEMLGLSQEELSGKLGDTGALLLDVIERMTSLEGVSSKLFVSEEIFGGQGGEEFVRMLEGGADGMRELMQQARDAGFVIDKHLIDRADETRDKLNQMQRLISVQLNSAFVELGPILLDVAKAFSQVAGFIADVVDGFRSLENQSTRRLEKRLDEVNEKLTEPRPQGGHALRAWKQRQSELSQEKFNLEDVIGKRRVSNAVNQSSRNAPLSIDSEATKAAAAMRDQVTKTIAALKFQSEQLTRSEKGVRTYQALQQAGIDGNHAEAETIAALVGSLYEQELAIKAKAKAEQDGEAITRSVMTAEEQRNATIARNNELLAAKHITAETARRANAAATLQFTEAEQQRLQAGIEADRQRLASSRDLSDGLRRAFMDIAEQAGNSASQIESAMTGAFSGMEAAMVSFVTTGKMDFKSLTNSILSDLARIAVQQSITKPLADMAGGLLSSVFGGMSVFHDGGVIGAGNAPLRLDHPANWNNAPRFHTGGVVGGLSFGEHRIIAEAGEIILNAAQQKNLAANMSSGPANVSVQVINNGPPMQAQTAVRQGSGNGDQIRVLVELVDEGLGKMIADGQSVTGNVIEGRYGMDPSAGAK